MIFYCKRRIRNEANSTYSLIQHTAKTNIIITAIQIYRSFDSYAARKSTTTQLDLAAYQAWPDQGMLDLLRRCNCALPPAAIGRNFVIIGDRPKPRPSNAARFGSALLHQMEVHTALELAEQRSQVSQ